MGMFDDLRCKYPLPVEGANALSFQTKDTPEQYLDKYEIREDGTLWHQTYDVEDRSDPNAEGLLRICGMATKVPTGWEPVPLTGEVRFYAFWRDEPGKPLDTSTAGWIEFSGYFVAGALRELHVIENRRPT